MHPASTINVSCHWQLLNNSLLLNNHARFQNIHGEEMSSIKNVMAQYIQVMLN